MKHVPRICAIILLVGFFLPFFSVFNSEQISALDRFGINLHQPNGMDFIETSLYLSKLPYEAFEVIESIFGLKAAHLHDQSGKYSLLLLATALIPIVSLSAIILDNRFTHFACGLIPITLLGAWFTLLGNPLLDNIAVGAGICIGAGMIQLFTSGQAKKISLNEFMVSNAKEMWAILIVLFWVGLIYDALVSRQLPLWLPVTGLILQITGGICWLTGVRQKLEERGISDIVQLVAAPFSLTILITWVYLWFTWYSGTARASDIFLLYVFSHSLAVALLSICTFRAYAKPNWTSRACWIIATAAFFPIWQWAIFVTDYKSLFELRVAVYKGGLAVSFFIGLAWTIRWVENCSRKIQIQRLSSVSPINLSRITPLDAMNQSMAHSVNQQKVWNPLDMDAWYYGRRRQKLKQSLNAFVCYASIFLAIFLFLMSLTGCDIYELPAGGGEPELKQIVKQVIKIKEVPIVNPLSNLIRPVPPIEEILKDLLEETMHRYETGQGKGKGAGFAGGTRRGKVRFIRLRYAGGDWDQDLDLNSDLNMLLWYSTNTGQPTAKLPETKSIGQLRSFPKGKSPPLVYMTGERSISISQSEVETLREFLIDKHGMIFADNGGSSGWHSQFFSLMRRVLPKVTPRAIPIDHPVHSGLSAIPIVAPHGGQTAYGWVVESRIVAYYHPGDVGDAWADGHAGVPRRIWEASYRLGGNIILYAHSEYSKWLQTQQKKD